MAAGLKIQRALPPDRALVRFASQFQRIDTRGSGLHSAQCDKSTRQ
jgi:hypothetical protein